MKRIFRKTVSFFLGVTMACTLAGGTAAVQAAEGGSDHEPITINALSRMFPVEFADALHEVYPEINLEVSSYGGVNISGFSLQSLVNDDIGDLYMTTQYFRKDLQPERLLDLSKYSFVNNYATSFLNSVEVDGGIYLLPTGYSLIGINYNKTLLEEHGWELPNSFEEMLTLKEQVEADGCKFMAHAMDLDGYPFSYFFNLGNTVYFGTPDGVNWKDEFLLGQASASDNEGIMETLAYFKKWIDNGLITNENTSYNDYLNDADTLFYLYTNQLPWEREANDGKTYEYAMIPWISEDGSSNMITYNVQGYWGINKKLEEPGNEQKLEDALHVMEFISSEEGQKILGVGSNQYMSPLSGQKVPETGPFVSVAEDANAGHLVPLVYAGWENVLTPISAKLRELMSGEQDVEQVAAYLDELSEMEAEGIPIEVYGTAAEDFTYEKTAELCAIAYGKAADADCALVSINDYGPENGYLFNREGIGWHIWAGDINSDMVDIIRSNGTTLTVQELTGAEIKDMLAEGYHVINGGGDYGQHSYLLATKGGIELQDDQTYSLAMSTRDLPEEVRESFPVVEITPHDAIRDYIQELGTFSQEDVVWE